MSNRITITIAIEVPDGASVSVTNGQEEPAVLPSLPTVAVVNGGGQVATGPICAIHHKAMRQGRYGPFCTAKAEGNQPADAKGYCAWKP